MTQLDPSVGPVDSAADQAEREQEAMRPAVIVLSPSLFVPHCSILRFRTGVPQQAFAQVRSMLRSDRFAKGAVTIVGHMGQKKAYYRDSLGRRRAEAVKAAIGGDKERCELIMQRIYKVETLDRHRHRWLNRAANELLELVHPEVETTWDKRIVHFQKECGLLGDGLCARETWSELLETYASYTSSMAWGVRGRVYSAMAEPGDEPGTVELWVWPETPPPEGTLRTWQTRAPIAIYQEAALDPLDVARAAAEAEAKAKAAAEKAAKAAAEKAAAAKTKAAAEAVADAAAKAEGEAAHADGQATDAATASATATAVNAAAKTAAANGSA